MNYVSSLGFASQKHYLKSLYINGLYNLLKFAVFLRNAALNNSVTGKSDLN